MAKKTPAYTNPLFADVLQWAKAAAHWDTPEHYRLAIIMMNDTRAAYDVLYDVWFDRNSAAYFDHTDAIAAYDRASLALTNAAADIAAAATRDWQSLAPLAHIALAARHAADAAATWYAETQKVLEDYRRLSRWLDDVMRDLHNQNAKALKTLEMPAAALDPAVIVPSGQEVQDDGALPNQNVEVALQRVTLYAADGI